MSPLTLSATDPAETSETPETPYSAGADSASADAERKLFETVRAAAALSGVQVYRLGDGSYLLQRWNLHRELPDLDAATALLRRMGVQV